MQADRFTIKSQEALRPPRSRSPPSAATRRSTPSTCSRCCSSRTDGIVVPVLRKLGADRRGAARRRQRALDALPTLGATPTSPRTSAELLDASCARAEREMRELERRVHLDRAPAARAGRPRARPATRCDAPARRATRCSRRSTRCAAPHRVTDQTPEDKFQALERFGRDLTRPPRTASSTRSSAATTRSAASSRSSRAARRTTPC